MRARTLAPGSSDRSSTRRPARKLAWAFALSTAGVLLQAAPSEAKRMVIHERDIPPPSFALDGAAIGGARAPSGVDFRAPAHLAGSTIASLPDGALVIDSDSGDLVRLDGRGAVVARVPIAPTASQLVVDRSRNVAFVADRKNDKVVVDLYPEVVNCLFLYQCLKYKILR